MILIIQSESTFKNYLSYIAVEIIAIIYPVIRYGSFCTSLGYQNYSLVYIFNGIAVYIVTSYIIRWLSHSIRKGMEETHIVNQLSQIAI